MTRHKVVVAQAMSFARNSLGQPDVVTNDHVPPSHFVKKVCAGSLKLLVCRPSITDIQNVAETQETSSALFEFAAGFEGVIEVTVSNSAATELDVTATRPTVIAAARRTDDNRRRAGVMERVSKCGMTDLSDGC